MHKTYHKITQACGNRARVVVVSKKRSDEEILAYYQEGVLDFGENRAQDLIAKANRLPDDIRWHFIGHLQRNKVRDVLPYVTMIHSVASLELLSMLEKEAARLNRSVSILIQFNLAEEATKSGLSKDQAIPFVEKALQCSHLDVRGIMCMGPHTHDSDQIRAVFHEARTLLEQLRKRYGLEHFQHLSMGMSQDWPIALEEGATILRIGTILFE